MFMSKIKWIAFFSILVLAGCGKKEGDGSPRQGVPIRTVPVAVQFISEPVRTSGYLSSETEARLSFKTGGIIHRLYVKEGERVRQGQTLAGLKLDEIRAYADQARNGYEKAKRDFERAQNLYRDSVATLEQVQDARTGLNVAMSTRDIAEFNLGQSLIAAPSDGRVLKKLADENELIGPGYPVFLFGTDGGEWAVKASATDRDAVRLAPGDSASVSFDAFPGEVFPSTVKTVSGAPDPMSGLFEVVLSLKIRKRNLAAGLMADVDLFPSDRREMTVVPFEALIDIDGLHGYVFTVADDSLAKKTPVTVGFLSNGSAAVERGLEKTDRVVTDGAAYLEDGMRVREVKL
jgi:multidrug efflux system membrane fusion protein